jgi:hypothetical protein
MSTPVCPACLQTTARTLPCSSEWSAVNYFRCDDCAHVWAIDKDAPHAVHHVTELRRGGAGDIQRRRSNAGLTHCSPQPYLESMAMRPLPCPSCRKLKPHKLDAPNPLAGVGFYACNSCGHVWATDSSGTEYVHFFPEIRRKADRRRETRREEWRSLPVRAPGVALVLRSQFLPPVAGH